VFAFLPIIDLWAFYRIRKLRKYVLYVIVPQIAITTVYFWYIYGSLFSAVINDPRADLSESFMAYDKNDMLEVLTQVVSWGLLAFSIYLVIIWSRQHNRQFDQPTQQAGSATQ
jgi:hypothetical protein